jgi:signal transduction histidine kinase
MVRSDSTRRRARGALLFAAGLAIATGLTAWLGWRATREWQRSTAAAADLRGNEVVTLLAAALDRDMKGGQVSVLLKVHERELAQVAPYELADRFARGFARFPYLESFFVWSAGGDDGSTYAFNRADRRPAWDREQVADDPYPVVLRRHPDALRSTVLLVRAQGRLGIRFTMFEVSIDGLRYQVVAQLLYDGVGEDATLKSAVGFLVNLGWVQQHYFADFLVQMQQILGDASLSLQVVDSDGTEVAAIGPPMAAGASHTRRFPLVFAEPALADAPQPFREPTWTMGVGVANARTLAAAARTGTRTLLLLGIATAATIIGLVVTLRGARRAAELADVQSEFVSAVSHEMKTPLSLITLASDTLAHGRYDSGAAVGDYGRMIATESQHLKRLIDNVLCYARVNDTSSPYDLEPLDVAELVQESADRFAARSKALHVDVQLHVPSEPPLVHGDRLMLGHVFDNLIDNVLTHAPAGQSLAISVTADSNRVQVVVVDRGEGIPEDDWGRVFEKFYRRKGTRPRGAGLGLAIVRRIVEDHEGNVGLTSRPGVGTTVTVNLPRAEATA